jgi:hypothetical protein
LSFIPAHIPTSAPCPRFAFETWEYIAPSYSATRQQRKRGATIRPK